MTIPANVKRGAELLDARLPGWRSRVDTDRLDLATSCNCVLGQVLGGYGEGLDLLGLSDAAASRHGFITYGRQTFRTLTDAWKRLLS